MHIKLKQVLRFILLLLIWVITGSKLKAQTELKTGIWRAELERADGQSIVFNFEVASEKGSKVIYIFNAQERLRVDQIHSRRDSIFIEMPFFQSNFYLRLINDNELTGTWVKDYATYLEKMPFKAIYGDKVRIPLYENAKVNVSGSWETTITYGDQTFNAIGLFNQKGNRVTGTFTTPAGDYRYLEGVVSGDTMKLSGFDGGHALYFMAIEREKGKLTDGKMYSINSNVANWVAEKRNYDSLPTSYSVNNVPAGTVHFNLKLRDMRTDEDKWISLNDPQYKGKVVILQLTGSWCPNCYDEAPFLIDYYKKNRNRGLEILGLDFERTEDYQTSKRALNSFLTRFNFDYPILFSGVAATDTLLTEKIFPGLPVKIEAFPTLILFDKSGYVRKVHIGFNGPATGKYYDEFKEEFNSIVNSLLME